MIPLTVIDIVVRQFIVSPSARTAALAYTQPPYAVGTAQGGRVVAENATTAPPRAAARRPRPRSTTPLRCIHVLLSLREEQCSFARVKELEIAGWLLGVGPEAGRPELRALIPAVQRQVAP